MDERDATNGAVWAECHSEDAAIALEQALAERHPAAVVHREHDSVSVILPDMDDAQAWGSIAALIATADRA